MLVVAGWAPPKTDALPAPAPPKDPNPPALPPVLATAPNEVPGGQIRNHNSNRGRAHITLAQGGSSGYLSVSISIYQSKKVSIWLKVKAFSPIFAKLN